MLIIIHHGDTDNSNTGIEKPGSRTWSGEGGLIASCFELENQKLSRFKIFFINIMSKWKKRRHSVRKLKVNSHTGESINCTE